MAEKYRVRESVGSIRHGVGSEVRSYGPGEIFSLSGAEAAALEALIEPVEDKGKKKKPAEE